MTDDAFGSNDSVRKYTDHAIYGRRVAETVSKPSFRASMDVWRRKGAHLSAATGRPRLSLAINSDKILQKTFYSSEKFSHPRNIIGPLPLRDTLAGLRQLDRESPLVMKPRFGKNSWLVYEIIIRDDRVATKDFIKKQTIEWDIEGFEDHCRAFSQKHGIEDDWIVEELLASPGGEPLHELKFYCFSGISSVCLNNRYTDGAKHNVWLDDQMNVLESAKEKTPNTMEAASVDLASYRACSRFAAELSGKLPLPFSRVDVYFNGRDCFAGEITPWPGYYFAFSPEIDEHLGSLMEMSELRMAENFPAVASSDPGGIWNGLAIGY